MDIYYIRNNKDSVKENQRKRFLDENIVDDILRLDEEWIKITFRIRCLNHIKNDLSKIFKNASKNETIIFDNTYTFDNFIDDYNKKLKNANLLTETQIRELSLYIKECINNKDFDRQTVLLYKRDSLIGQLGNLLDFNVIISKNENDNKVIYTKDIIPDENNKNTTFLYTHIQLGEMLDIVDTKNGIEIVGNRGYFLKGLGVKLNLALLNYACDFVMAKNFELMATPHFVLPDLMNKVTQLSDNDETLYKIKDQDKYLIATSEQPLTAYFNDKMINKKELPIKYAGVSTCYRKETGAHGKQTRGIFRVHQFEKVEQFCVTEPNKSRAMFTELIENAKEFYDSLDINYRVISIVSGALNNAASIKYDIEAYFPSSKFYGELVSCSNCLDYFSKRINTQLRRS